jgi:hypothetical protein
MPGLLRGMCENESLKRDRTAMNPQYQQKPDLIAADLDGETVMMSVTTGKYFALRGSAKYIWELLAEPVSLDEIIDAVETNYAVGRAQAEADCQRFIDDLVAKDLLNTL